MERQCGVRSEDLNPHWSSPPMRSGISARIVRTIPSPRSPPQASLGYLAARVRHGLAEEIVDAFVAHPAGVGELAAARGEQHLVLRQDDHCRGDALLDRVAVGGRDVEVVIEIAD